MLEMWLEEETDAGGCVCVYAVPNDRQSFYFLARLPFLDGLDECVGQRLDWKRLEKLFPTLIRLLKNGKTRDNGLSFLAKIRDPETQEPARLWVAGRRVNVPYATLDPQYVETDREKEECNLKLELLYGDLFRISDELTQYEEHGGGVDWGRVFRKVAIAAAAVVIGSELADWLDGLDFDPVDSNDFASDNMALMPDDGDGIPIGGEDNIWEASESVEESYASETGADSQVSFTGRKEDLEREIRDTERQIASEQRSVRDLSGSSNVADQNNAAKHARRIPDLTSKLNDLQRELAALKNDS